MIKLLIGILAGSIFIGYLLNPISDTSEASLTLEQKFENFISDYGASYTTENEYLFRMKVFQENMKTAEWLNELNPDAEFGVTKFSGLTKEEMRKIAGSFESKGEKNQEIEKENQLIEKEIHESPAVNNIDWRSHFPDIGDQGSCGSWYAFGVLHTIEAYLHIKHGPIYPKLSEQHLIDCAKGCDGCDGWQIKRVYDFYSEYYTCSDKEYPYVGKESQKCDMHKCPTKIDNLVTGETKVKGGEEGIRSHVLQHGPVQVIIDADYLFHYTGGVIHRHPKPKNFNHAVIISGYNADSARPHFIIRNSWGTDWSINGGYFYVQYGKGLMGLDQYPSVPKF